MLECLRLPPFGKILRAYQEEKIQLYKPIYLFVGQEGQRRAYSEKKFGLLCTYLPFEDSFERYNWPLTGQHIVMEDTGMSDKIFINKFCLHLLEYYTPRVIFFYSETLENQLFLPQGASYNG
jgi:hypothetical protein